MSVVDKYVEEFEHAMERYLFYLNHAKQIVKQRFRKDMLVEVMLKNGHNEKYLRRQFGDRFIKTVEAYNKYHKRVKLLKNHLPEDYVIKVK